MADIPAQTRTASRASPSAIAAPARRLLGAQLFESLLRPARRRDATQTVRQLRPHIFAGDHVLDLGCGTGLVGALLEQEVGCRATGCDVAPTNTALEDFRLFDGEELPFLSGAFDVVILAYVLHHVPDPSSLVREAARVTRRSIVVLEDTPITWADRLWGHLHVAGFNGLYELPQARVRSETAWHDVFANAGLRLCARTPIGRLERFPPVARTQFVLAHRQTNESPNATCRASR